jgi:hypothetical protein
MNIYHYTPDTYIFCAEGVADESPLEPGVFLVPANATTVAPPELGDSEIAVFSDGAWQVETLPPPPEPEPEPEPTTPVVLTPAEKLEALGLTIDELKTLLGLN